MGLDCLILAAGASSRFGECKLLVDWRGKPLLASAIAAARSLIPDRIIIVTGAFHREITAHAELLIDVHQSPPAQLIRCSDWQLGMGHSLAYGVNQLVDDNAVLILLGDQPLVNDDDLRRLYTAWKTDSTRITCAAFAGTLGVPAIFPATTKPRLLQLKGERGAKGMLTTANTCSVPMPNAALDIDTRADLIQLTQGYHHDYAQN